MPLRTGAMLTALALTLCAGMTTAQTGAPAPGAGRDERQAPRPAIALPSDVAVTPRGAPEYVLIVPPGQSAAALAALSDAGGSVLRQRNLPALGRVLYVFELQQAQAPDTLRPGFAAVAPGARIDFNHLYGFAQARPRLFAADLLGEPADGGCTLPQSLSIGMIDGPVNAAHPALAGTHLSRLSVLLPDDRAGSADHGTGVAALLVGEDSTAGYRGFAVGASVVSVDAFAREGNVQRADVERLAAALDLLAGSGVRLVNLSLSGPSDAVLEEVVARTASLGVVMVAAVGNDGAGVGYPAAHPNTIAVTAVDAAARAYRRAGTGPEVEFAAPGVDLWVAEAEGGHYATGTSFAAPIVTALIAREMAAGTRNIQSLRRLLADAASDLGPSGRDTQFGWGLVRGGC